MTVEQLAQEYKNLDISLSQRERWSEVLGNPIETLSVVVNDRIMAFSSLPQEIRQQSIDDIAAILQRTVDEWSSYLNCVDASSSFLNMQVKCTPLGTKLENLVMADGYESSERGTEK